MKFSKGSAAAATTIIIIVLALIIIGGGIWYFVSKKQTLQQSGNSQLYAPRIGGEPCNRYAYESSVVGFLPTYTVRRGDSLLSIAKSELNDASRVGEIIEINKQQFPGLSLEKSFIEVGWKLTLPPKEIKTGGNIKVSSGKLVDIRDSGTRWLIDETGSGSGGYSHYPKQGIISPVIEDGIKVGDCIDILHDYMGIKQIYIISLQK
jgi:hypothetical protein